MFVIFLERAVAGSMDDAVAIVERLPTSRFDFAEVREALGLGLRREIQAW